MKLQTKALSLSLGILWGGAVLLTALANILWPGYGKAFLDMTTSLYPGFHASGTLGDAIVGFLYAALDGLICGFLIAWLYNLFAGES